MSFSNAESTDGAGSLLGAELVTIRILAEGSAYVLAAPDDDYLLPNRQFLPPAGHHLLNSGHSLLLRPRFYIGSGSSFRRY